MSDAEAGAGTRDLFWRRAAAGLVDIAVLVVIANLAAVALYAASDGRLRSSPLLKQTHCQPLQGISVKVLQGVSIPPGARPVAAQACAVTTLGLEASRYVSVVLQAQEGEMTRSMAFSRPVDRAGLPIRPVVLDWAWPLAFIVVMSLWETLLGATVGKRLLGLRVTAEGGGRLGFGRALLRNGVLYGGAALVLLAPLVAALLGIQLPPFGYYAAVGFFGLLVLAPFAMLAEASPRARYDRWAGAEVVRA